jgi:hypothetical protein
MFFPGKYKFFYLISLAFFFVSLFPSRLWAQTEAEPAAVPAGTPSLRAVRLDPKDPLRMEFIFNSRVGLSKAVVSRTVEYFLAAMTIPEQDLWVNLSPYEQGRVMDDGLAKTSFGESLLKEDYLLKQLAASLTNPETEAGKKYWDEINSTPLAALGGSSTTTSHGALRAGAQSSFTKVWIVPAGAQVKENGYAAYIEHSALEVLTDEDFTAKKKNSVGVNNHSIDSFRKHILPLINKEVNEGESFAQLRQMYNAFVLATWFKRKVKESIFKDYIDRDKVSGIDRADKNIKEKVYAAYLEAFKKGAYDYVKTERERPLTPSLTKRGNDVSALALVKRGPAQPGRVLGFGTKITRRRYFSGGVQFTSGHIAIARDSATEAQLRQIVASGMMYLVYLSSDLDLYSHNDTPRAFQAFYGAGLDSAQIASHYHAYSQIEERMGDDTEDESITLGPSQEKIITTGARYKFMRPGHYWDVDVAVRLADADISPAPNGLFFACYRENNANLVLRPDNPLSGKIKAGDKISEIAEAAEMIYWQSRIANDEAQSDQWGMYFCDKYDPIDIPLPELFKIKALMEIVKAYGKDDLTPLQKKYLSFLREAPEGAEDARVVIHEMGECFMRRHGVIEKYLGESDTKLLFDYIKQKYLPALHAIADPNRVTDGGVVISSQNISVNGNDGLVFNISPGVRDSFKKSAGINFWVEAAPVR